jgi:hypothetical protein
VGVREVHGAFGAKLSPQALVIERFVMCEEVILDGVRPLKRIRLDLRKHVELP